jgi:predicted TPR repeat methyltransferase
MLGMGHPDPIHCAQICQELEVSKEALIFDFGCGTGLVGDELVKLGFNPDFIWGCDAS